MSSDSESSLGEYRSHFTFPYILFTICWITLLIMVIVLLSHPWYLLLAGGIGMFQDVIISGSPQASMLHLENLGEEICIVRLVY